MKTSITNTGKIYVTDLINYKMDEWQFQSIIGKDLIWQLYYQLYQHLLNIES